MIVAMRDNIKPLCDRHFSLMKLEGFAAQNIQLTFRAYVCKEPGCTRAYNSTIGYHDIIMNKGVSFAERVLSMELRFPGRRVPFAPFA
jgi:hypothetical protein